MPVNERGTSSSSSSPGKTVRPNNAAVNDPTKKKKKKSVNNELYTNYILKIMKQIKPGVRITPRAMSIMNSFVFDAFERIAAEAGKLCMYAKKDTLTSNEIRTAVRLVLPGDLAKHAILEGVHAVQTFTDDSGSKRA